MPACEIVSCVDGPLLVRGDFELVAPDGEPVECRRSTVALCRCGSSAIKPFCDGTHKLTGFRSESPPEVQPEPVPESVPEPKPDAGEG